MVGYECHMTCMDVKFDVNCMFVEKSKLGGDFYSSKCVYFTGKILGNVQISAVMLLKFL